MKSSSEYFPVVLFNVPVQGSSNFGVCMWMKSASVSFKELNSTLVLFVILYDVSKYKIWRYGLFSFLYTSQWALKLSSVWIEILNWKVSLSKREPYGSFHSSFLEEFALLICSCYLLSLLVSATYYTSRFKLNLISPIILPDRGDFCKFLLNVKRKNE